MNKAGQIRIIGGKWRGRKLLVANLPALRPTPDRVRETLFNWLALQIPGAHCLDAFAGSGALGFEALSRGAATVVMVDQSLAAVSLIQQTLRRFEVPNAEVYQAHVPQELKRPAALFDIVFLDPPYAAGHLIDCCFYLEENAFLADNAYLYLESASPLQADELPAEWRILKTKQAGQVAYHLVVRNKHHGS